MFYQDPTFWVLVAFVIFFAGIGKKLWKFVATYLNQHSIKIEEKIKDAIRMREEAQALLGDIRKKQMEAEQQAKAIMEHAQAQMDHMREEARLEIDKFLKNRERLAQDRIQHAKNQALKDIRGHAIRVSVQASEKLLKEQVDSKTDTHLIDQAIKTLEQQIEQANIQPY